MSLLSLLYYGQKLQKVAVNHTAVLIERKCTNITLNLGVLQELSFKQTLRPNLKPASIPSPYPLPFHIHVLMEGLPH